MLSAILESLHPPLRASLKAVYDQLRILINHRRGCLQAAKLPKDRPWKVQFGCGPERKGGWINTDMWPGPWAKPDFCLDVSRPLPFPDETVDTIYSEHMLEHLDYPKTAYQFLKECLRVLKPDGLMHVGVPDLDLILADFHRTKIESFHSISSSDPRYVLNHPVEILNYFFHQGGDHKFLYNEAFLKELLGEVGFVAAARRAYDSSLDSPHREAETLYIVARKSN
jgi:predicted SAM-dependent methyltransferase